MPPRDRSLGFATLLQVVGVAAAALVAQRAESLAVRVIASLLALILVALVLLALARFVAAILDASARWTIRVLASGGLFLLRRDLDKRDRHPEPGTVRNVLYTGGLGVLRTPDSGARRKPA